MNNKYVNIEVEKIINDKQFPYPQNMAMATVWIMGNMKGQNFKILNVSEISSLADYFVLGSATNPIQAKSMGNEILYQLKKNGHQAISVEGLGGDCSWILLDLGEILVHIFLDSTREIYDLDQLWNRAPSISIPQSYYISAPPVTSSENEDEKKYF